MFSITGVYLENFKSFAGKHDLGFPEEPGLYFLTGRNKNEPKLGSNGAGKSTLLDAIHWCLYGQTLRGLKATDVVTWGKKSCAVAVGLKIFGEATLVTRTQSPNSLTIDTPSGKRVVTQDELNKHIGINADSFVHSVILPQFGQSFFELKPAEKLALFSQIMDLDFWLDKSQQATDAAKAIEKDINKTTNDIESNKNWIVSVKVDIDEFTGKEGDFEAARDEAIKDIKNQITVTEDNTEILLKKRDKIAKELKHLDENHNALGNDLDHIDKAKATHQGNREKLVADCAVFTSQLETMTYAIKKLESVGASCPVCLQAVDAKHLRNEKRKIQIQVEAKEISFHATRDKLAETNKFLSKATKDHNNLVDQISELHSARSELKNTLAKIRFDTDNADAQIKELKNEVKEKINEENPYTKMLNDRREKLSKLENKTIVLKDTLEKLNTDHAATVFWVQGFKRVRLFIIEETLRALELEVNNSLTSLGLIDWQVEFDVERENKSGGITKGFVVFIRCPANPEPVRWESWSGGETQRLQLAGDFGLANLIMTRAGLTNNIEFYDEPSDHLSDEGLVDLAETLQQRAMNDNKRILLVDHRMPDFGDFAGVITIIKDEKGSSII